VAQRPNAAIKTSCRRLAGVLAATLPLAVSACGGGGVAEPGIAQPAQVTGFAGVLAADEPRAALAGREVLANNGNAIDAAVAMGFTMAVTLPSRVGLGGGGACLVHKRDANAQEALIFLPEGGAAGAPVPKLARGLAALHARYGLNPWNELVQPAERLAAFGHAVSRAFWKDLVVAGANLSPRAAAVYRTAEGARPDVGDRITQPALGAALAGIRQQGAGYTVTGGYARSFVEGAQGAGQSLDLADLRANAPRFAEPLRVAFGPHGLYLPPAPVAAGPRVARVWDELHAQGAALSKISGMTDLIAAWRDSGEPAAPDSGAGFAVADRFGNIVACGFTLNGLFGAGHLAGASGVLLAASPGETAPGRDVLPAMVVNANTATGYVGAHGGPDQTGQLALLQTLGWLEANFEDGGDTATTLASATPGPYRERSADQISDRQASDRSPGSVGLDGLLTAPRVALLPAGPRYEPGVRDGIHAALADDATEPAASRVSFGRLMLLVCPGGVGANPGTCRAAADPRSEGMALRAP